LQRFDRVFEHADQQLDVSFVRRMARGQALTEPVGLLANLATPHVAALPDVTSAIGRESRESYGLLRVTAPAGIGTHPRQLSQQRRDFPVAAVSRERAAARRASAWSSKAKPRRSRAPAR
jgi:hypothetical protein